ncbi:protein phosphatase 2C domain-containing protein [Bradymonas sediminis]|uniref:protein phosphatase 2C domain-containing protein n=1 Tax=Bradymonas sediminis TaxID=1548548 RepID=UPI0010D884D1|nr:protein phosphatase 2C domain-containing protein [Bradymonas sediminis]TDP76632.1 serine/threonine protein phosphatase PrpC [Bradymonas sediminis]
MARGERCGNCGHMPDDADANTVWLEVGDHFSLSLDPGLLGLKSDDSAPLRLELELVELWEHYDHRRVLLAHLGGWSCGDIAPNDAQFCENLTDLTLVVEQEVDDVLGAVEFVPNNLKHWVRRPITELRREGTKLSVFRNDGGLALDEMVEVGVGRLSPRQIRSLFLPVLNAVALVHREGLVHLRLTPWLLRMRDRKDPEGIPLEFLRDVMNVDEAGQRTGLGDEETFSEDEGEAAAPAPLASSNPFAMARELEVTRDDVIPLSGGETVASDTAPAPAHAAAAISGLELLFDGIDGFVKVDANLENILFTRGFSAPELIAQGPIDNYEACDIFSLGMVLYFLVAGQIPPVSVYTRETPAIPACNLRPDFPPGLQAVIGRATRPDPAERYPTVDALLKAFEYACDVMVARAEGTRAQPPRVSVAVDTHVGIAKGQRNPVNQDAVFVGVSEDHRLSLMVVADGVSTASYGSGDLASGALAAEASVAWEELHEAYKKDEAIEPQVVLQEILNRANDRLVDYVNARFLPFRGGPHEVMGSTVLAAIFYDGVVTLVTLGDSRVYLSRGDFFEQVTTDHNLWTLSILDGMAADSALAMPHGDALARCLGTFMLRDERLHALNPEPDVISFPLLRGDTLLLTTDGLVDFAAAHMLTAEDYIHHILVSEPDPALACLELILLANRGGGGDNIGVGIAKFI